MKDFEHGWRFVAKVFIDPKNGIQKIHDIPRHDVDPTTLIVQADEQSRIWNE